MKNSIIFANPVVLIGLAVMALFFTKFGLRIWYMFTKPAGSDFAKQETIDNIPVHIPSLPKRLEYYDNIANELENNMQNMGTNTGPMFEKLQGLNTEELIAVWKAFGVRSNKMFAITTFSGNLGEWFDAELQDIFERGNLEKMKKIWAPTGLW